jgi:hypothetical protein
MSESTTTVLTTGSILFEQEDAGDAVRGALNDWGGLQTVTDGLAAIPAGLREAALERLGGVVAEALDLDVTSVLKLGWQRYSSLTDAARRSVDTPGAEEVVELATHRITSSHEPHVELIYDDVPIATIALRIDLKLDLHAVQAVIAGGRLVALRSGRVDLHADLSCEGVPVKSATRSVDLNLVMELGAGIALVQPSEPVVIPDAPMSA